MGNWVEERGLHASGSLARVAGKEGQHMDTKTRVLATSSAPAFSPKLWESENVRVSKDVLQKREAGGTAPRTKMLQTLVEKEAR